MGRTGMTTLSAVILLGLIAPSVAQADPTHNYTAGHADLGIAYDGGTEFDFHFHFQNAVLDGVEVDELRAAPDAYWIVNAPWSGSSGEMSPFVMPPEIADSHAFTGVGAGETLYYLSWNPIPGSPYLGFGTEELASRDWDGPIHLSVIDVRGPGAFSIWAYDPVGVPIVEYSGVPGFETDPIEMPTHSHAHYNWGFSAEGLYEVTFRGTGTYIGGPSPVQVDSSATYYFNVGPVAVPEPSAIALAGLGLIGLGCFYGPAGRRSGRKRGAPLV